MTETFYRVHWADCPPLTADNAWSALWGATRTADGTQTQCVPCDGTGKDATDPVCRSCDGERCAICDHTGYSSQCQTCDGEGVIDCERGYSCFTDPKSLIAYFTDPGHAVEISPDDHVIAFEGTHQGLGFDGEDLAIPTRILQETTWTEFLTLHNLAVTNW